MILLIGVSVGFALSTLTSNNFYSEKVFTSSVHQWVGNEIQDGRTQQMITKVQNEGSQQVVWNGGKVYYGGAGGSLGGQQERNIVQFYRIRNGGSFSPPPLF